MGTQTVSDTATLVDLPPTVHTDPGSTTDHLDDDAATTAGDANDDRDTVTTAERHPRMTWIRRIRWRRVLVYGALPGLALMLAVLAGYLKWLAASAHDSQQAGIDSVRAASDSTTAILSYTPDTIDKDLAQASERLTGQFKDAYTALIRDVVIPGSKQQKISSVATVPAAAPVSATENHAVVLVFVDQAITIGGDPPTTTASSVRVTLDKVHDQWRISQFDPI